MNEQQKQAMTLALEALENLIGYDFHGKPIGYQDVAGVKAITALRSALAQEAPYTCKYCGLPSWIDPSDQSPPPDYCNESDHRELNDD